MASRHIVQVLILTITIVAIVSTRPMCGAYQRWRAIVDRERQLEASVTDCKTRAESQADTTWTMRRASTWLLENGFDNLMEGVGGGSDMPDGYRSVIGQLPLNEEALAAFGSGRQYLELRFIFTMEGRYKKVKAALFPRRKDIPVPPDLSPEEEHSNTASQGGKAMIIIDKGSPLEK